MGCHGSRNRCCVFYGKSLEKLVDNRYFHSVSASQLTGNIVSIGWSAFRVVQQLSQVDDARRSTAEYADLTVRTAIHVTFLRTFA
jgi:hypothetical protein